MQKEKMKCWMCGAPHIRRDCPEGKRGHDNPSSRRDDTKSMALVSNQSLNLSDPTDWIIDSGCTENVCCQLENFATYKELEKKVYFILSNGQTVKALETGKINVKSHVNGEKYHLENVMYVPDMKTNLFSVTLCVTLCNSKRIDSDNSRKKWLFKKKDKLIVDGYGHDTRYSYSSF